MNFTIIDKQNWERKEYFDHYFSNIPCTYSMTVELDISSLLKKLKHKNIKLYPFMLYGIAHVVNTHDEFRMSIDENGNLGIYDIINPSYTIFHKDNETFSEIWTDYSADFKTFYQNYLSDMEQFGNIKKMIAKPHLGNNLFNISCIPWASFTAFNLNLEKGYRYLSPIFTLGKYHTCNEKIMLPLCIQAHHAVCDGYHVARLVNELQELINTFTFL